MWNYQAPPWLKGGHWQTIYAAKLASCPDVAWRRERWMTPDDDFIDLDWASVEDGRSIVEPMGVKSDANLGQHDKPLLVLFHGLEGSSQSRYARAFAVMAKERNWQLVVVHFRGCSGEPNRAPRAYHSGDYEEIDWILKRFKQFWPGKLYAAGVSLGGNALLKWAGVFAKDAASRVDAVASVCAPLDLMVSGLALGQGLNRLFYTRMFLKTMRVAAKQKFAQHPGLFDLERALAAQTLYEFDDAFTAPLHGFAGVEDYWTKASSKPTLVNIQVPALVLNARNDPFVPVAAWPQTQDLSSSVDWWPCEEGGHVGFTAGAFPGHLMAMPRAVGDWLGQR